MIKLHYGGKDLFFHEHDLLTPGYHYNNLCNISSDINEHLPTLKRYSEECETVTEMGVRFACSTWAFIEAMPKKLTCIDINQSFFEPSDKWIRKICKNYEIEFNWVTGDTLKIDIENTDLLFIDTLHTYNQLFSELEKHSKNVNKFIVLHDTVTYGFIDESIYNHASDLIKSKKQEKTGLISALNNFLETTEGKNWEIFETFTNNNGLTILRRKN